MNFHRIISCLTLISGILFLSGCTEEENCIVEDAEDYELNEIFFDLSVSPHLHNTSLVKVKFAMYALDDAGNKIPLQSKKESRIDIRANGSACKLLLGEFCSSYLNYPDAYTCSFDVGSNVVPEGMVITAGYQRGDIIAEASLRAPGRVSDIQLQERVNPGDEKWVFSLKNDMTISWKLPEVGRPDAIQVQIVRNREDEKQILFEETLRGDAAGITIPRNTFEHFASSPLKLSVTAIANGTITPLVAGGSTQVEKTVEKECLALACGADEIESAPPRTGWNSRNNHRAWRCKTKASEDTDDSGNE